MLRIFKAPKMKVEKEWQDKLRLWKLLGGDPETYANCNRCKYGVPTYICMSIKRLRINEKGELFYYDPAIDELKLKTNSN